MFEDYRKKVKLVYDQKKEADAISMNLIHPTTARLKRECIKVYRERYSRKDDYILNSFFEPSTEKEFDYGQIIKNFDVDKFRPLRTFLLEGKIVPLEKNIELLAWLIDFEQRPYSVFEKSYEEAEDNKTKVVTAPFNEVDINDITNASKPDSKEKSEAGGTEKVKVIATDGITTGKTHSKTEKLKTRKKPILTSKFNIGIFSLTVVLAIICGTYLVSGDEPPQECMYWTGDHYQAISCNKKIDNTAIIALDTSKLNHLQRITEPDTLTASSLGKVWYTKVDGELEFYTANGYHPLDDDKRLMPITVYMLNKYVRRK